jgi:hypothetical protein
VVITVLKVEVSVGVLVENHGLLSVMVEVFHEVTVYMVPVEVPVSCLNAKLVSQLLLSKVQ